MTPDPASGVAEDGTWTPAFEGQRPPWQRGNLAALKHGAKSVLSLSKRADEIREELVDDAPVKDPADGAAFDLCALTLAQAEVAALLVQRVRRDQLDAVALGERLSAEEMQAHARLAQDLRGWINSCGRLLTMLGMTPLSRAQLGLDIARAQESVVMTMQREARRQEEDTA
jgi:hypothetical protein